MECKQAAIEQNLKLAGCYALTTNVTPAKLDAEQVHTSYMALEKVERRLRAAFGVTETNPDAIMLPDALAGGGRKHRDQTAPARPEPAGNSGGTRHPPASDVVRHSFPPRERQLISPINHLSALLRPFPAGRSVW